MDGSFPVIFIVTLGQGCYIRVWLMENSKLPLVINNFLISLLQGTVMCQLVASLCRQGSYSLQLISLRQVQKEVWIIISAEANEKEKASLKAIKGILFPYSFLFKRGFIVNSSVLLLVSVLIFENALFLF